MTTAHELAYSAIALGIVAALVLAIWTSGWAAGYRRARQAEIERARTRQRQLGERTRRTPNHTRTRRTSR